MATSKKSATTQNSVLVQKIRKHLEDNEEKHDYPYLDSDGLITIGVGFNVDKLSDFLALELNINGKKATDTEKRAAYKALKAQSKGKNATAYRSSTRVRMADADINKRLNGEITKRLKQVEQSVGNQAVWQKMSDEEKIIAVDIQYAVGETKFRNGWGQFKKALALPQGTAAEREARSKEIARQTFFYSDKTQYSRNWDRIERNYCMARGKPFRDPTCQAELRGHFPLNKKKEKNPAGAEFWKRAPKAPTQPQGTPAPPAAPIQTPFNDGQESDQNRTRLADSRREQRKATPLSGEAAALAQRINETPETLGEMLSKPANRLTKKEIDRIVGEKSVMALNDSRRRPAEETTASWFHTIYGGLDGLSPDAANEAARRRMPANRIDAVDPRGKRVQEGLNEIGGTVASLAGQSGNNRSENAIRELQETLNNANQRAGASLPDLKPDGRFGPKTGERLRESIIFHGAGAILNDLKKRKERKSTAR